MFKILLITIITVFFSFPASANFYNKCKCVCQNGEPVEICPRGTYSSGSTCAYVYDCLKTY